MTSANLQSFPFQRTMGTFHTPATPDERRASVFVWLADFSHAVQQRDYDHARTLFHPDVFAFGTRTSIMQTLDQLVEEQWRPIWEATAGYQFVMDQVHFDVQDDLAWIAAPFMSRSRDSASPHLHRTGRATYVLRWTGGTGSDANAGRWRAVHSHHSLDSAWRSLP